MLPEGKSIYFETLYDMDNNGMIQSHFHDYYEIFYLLDGERRYFINHTLFDVVPHDVILVNKGDVHIVNKLAKNKYTRCLITFSDSFIEGLGPEFSKDYLMRIFDNKKLHIPEPMQNAFSILLHKAESRVNNTDLHSQYIVKISLIEILLTLNKLSAKSEYPLIDNLSVYEDRIQDVCHYMCNYYNEQITLEQMAKIAYMSPTYFSKKFKRVTGFGFKEYLNNIRIKMATSMLMETQYSITEIATYCGYHDSNYFGDVFKKLIGVSPNKYRKDHFIV